jgi:hypothetical protein
MIVSYVVISNINAPEKKKDKTYVGWNLHKSNITEKQNHQIGNSEF